MFSCLFGGSSIGENPDGIKFSLNPHFGYVVLVAVSSFFLVFWQALKVGKARKLHGIKYPTMYASGTDEKSNLFNCVQRVHQNTLEMIPYFLCFLLLGGLEMPVFSAICGVVFILGRIAYSKGYYTGKPENRMRGAWGSLGMVALVIPAAKFGFSLACNCQH